MAGTEGPITPKLDNEGGGNPQDDNIKINALISTTIEIFKRELVVAFEKKDNDGYSFLLVPTKTDDAPKISITDMINDTEKLFNTKTTINTEDLEKLVSADKFNNVTVSLTMAFLYINKEEDKKEEVEFAFQVKADGLDNLIPNGLSKLITIKDIQLAIWSTHRNKIIEAMKLTTPEEFSNNWK